MAQSECESQLVFRKNDVAVAGGEPDASTDATGHFPTSAGQQLFYGMVLQSVREYVQLCKILQSTYLRLEYRTSDE